MPPAAPSLPPAVGRPYEHHDLHARGTWLVLNDVHIPFHDVTVLRLAIDQAVREKVAGVLLNGDIFDFHGISRFDRHPDEPGYKQEIEAGRQFLTYLRHRLPKARIVFKEGNHEERLYSYLFRHCRELWELDELTLPSLFRFAEHGLEYVNERRVMLLGKLHVLHGHEYVFSMQNPVNPARGLFLRSKGVALCGHFHQTSEHTEPTIGRDLLACWSIGCACGLSPRYFPLNKWNSGFAFVEVSEDGMFSVRNYRVLDGRVV